MNSCIFCKIITGAIPSKRVLETNTMLVIEDITPKAQIHWLIIPKQHFDDICAVHNGDASLFADMFAVTDQLAQLKPETRDFRLIINRGSAAGQTVFHMHMHFLAGNALPGF
ncbi:MAG: HIT domain-containing protein [Candidatus Babeliales bacterium]